jgi:hypothetical protein
MPVIKNNNPLYNTKADKILPHPNTPKRLSVAFRKARSFHRLSERLDVNVSYVYSLIVKGIEPTNSDVRTKLFLPRHKRQFRALKPPLTEHEKRTKRLIRGMRAETEGAMKENFHARQPLPLRP